jgi:hypothetical protein
MNQIGGDMSHFVLRTWARNAALTVPALSRLIRQRDALLDEIYRLTEELRHAIGADRTRQAPPKAADFILDAYSHATPSAQNAFDLFKGEWSSEVPGFDTGGIQLFADHRIEWLEQKCGGFKNKRILELGPLEAGHTFMMASRGAASITSIEANVRAFLKCLIVRQALGFTAEFLLGDFCRYVKECRSRFDFVLASGVLYHMVNPVELLNDICRITDSLGVWTHYFDRDVIASAPNIHRKFDPSPQVLQFNDLPVSIYRQHYLDALGWKGFCGGPAPVSYWMTKESILGVLDRLGFAVEIGIDDTSHPNGPSMLFFAKRKSAR